MVGQLMVATTANHATHQKLLTEFIRISPSLSDAGWGGYVTMVASGLFYAIMGSPNVTWAQANATWDPFHAYANSLASEGLQVSTAMTAPFDSWHSWYNNFLPPELTGNNFELGTRLLSRDLVVNNYQNVAQTLSNINVGYMSVVFPRFVQRQLMIDLYYLFCCVIGWSRAALSRKWIRTRLLSIQVGERLLQSVLPPPLGRRGRHWPTSTSSATASSKT